MNEKLEALYDALHSAEQQLDQAYIVYAKKMDSLSHDAKKTINVMTDHVIQLKKQIQIEERTHKHD